MKPRMTALLVLLILSAFLTACSLAEDITPPPGYPSLTSPLPPEQATRSAQPVLTNRPTVSLETDTQTATPWITPAGTELAPFSSGINTTSTAPFMKFNGKVTNASSTSLSAKLTATLYLYNSGSSKVSQTLTTEVQPSGLYQFFNVPADMKTTYFVMVEYDGVTYTSDPTTYDGTITTHDMPVTIYDATNDLNTLSLVQVHAKFDFSVEGKVQAQMLYIISNPSSKSVVVTSNGTNVPFIRIPAGASDVQYELAQGGAPLMIARNGFAFIPGADKHYGLIATFSLPYSRSLKFIQPFSLPVASETIIVPEGVRVQSDQVEDAGTQAFQGITYHLYQGSSLASGSTLALIISGKPGETTGFSLTRQTGILIGFSVTGILLIALGVLLYLHDHVRLVQESEVGDREVEIGIDTLGSDRDTILDAIIALDAQFKDGGISREAYEKRRGELKERLKQFV